MKAVNLVVGFRLSQVLGCLFSGQVQIAFQHPSSPRLVLVVGANMPQGL
jgi:hypothetical protein